MCEWLNLPEAPTAVVAGTDRHAIAIVDAVRSTGRRMPEDLAIITFGDTALAAYFGLTAVRLPMSNGPLRFCWKPWPIRMLRQPRTHGT